MPTPSEVIIRELQFRLGNNVPVVAEPAPEERSTYIRIGDNPFTQFYYMEGDPFTPEIADRWCRDYIANRDRDRGLDPVRYTFNADPTRWIQVPGNFQIPGTVEVENGVVNRRIEGVTVNTVNETTIPAVGTVGIRTPEQEARYQYLLNEGRTRIFTPGEGVEYERLFHMLSAPLTPLTPLTPQVPQRRIRVRVIRDDNGYWAVSVQVGGQPKELPKVAVIKALLPPSEKHFIPNRQGRYRNSLRLLQTALETGLPAQSLHDALKAWALATESAATRVESDTPVADESQLELLRAQPATLEVGGKVYKLVPCGEIDVRPLITRVRTRALATARVEGEAIRTRAGIDARLVVSQAEQSAQAMRAAIAQERARLGNPVPEWVKTSRRSHKWDGSLWSVQLMVSCKVDKIRLSVPMWETILYWNALTPRDDSWYMDHRMPVWLKLHPEGVYTLNDVNMRGEWECVHIAHYCCMELQGLPPAITNNDLAVRLENGLSRGMRVINLNSPLGVHTHKYWPDFKAQIPNVPLGFLESGRPSDSYLNPGRVGIEQWKALNPRVRWDSEESTREEAEGVFTVREDTNATTR